MHYEVTLRDNTSQPLAVVSERVEMERFGDQITSGISRVYEFLSTSSVRPTGHNVVLYRDADFASGARVELGVEVSERFEDSSGIQCSATPSGRVATTLHVGAYDQLNQAHHAVRNWCEQSGHKLAGPHWEVYGDWNDDPRQVRTEVVYLLGNSH